MVSQMAGIATTTIHAPLTNLLNSTITSTTPVKHAPTELITLVRCMCRRTFGSVVNFRCRFQCRIMPVWLHTNETNTPMMYSWIRRVGEASNTTISKIAKPDSIRMPLLNASRSPRLCSCRGR